MAAARITRSTLPAFAALHYEQCPMGRERGIVKFDHEPVEDGRWRRLNKGSTALYRYADGFFQMVAAESEDLDLDFPPLLAAIENAGPLQTTDELEILIRPAGSGFEMTSVFINHGPGARFSEFSPRPWNAAYQRLLEIEDQF